MTPEMEEKQLTEVTVLGQSALTAENIRATGWSVTSWLDGRDVVFIAAPPGPSSQKMAASYLKAG